MAALGGLVSVLAGLFFAYVGQAEETERRRGELLERLSVPLELASRDGDLRLITTITSFATAADVTLAELHLEAFLPADDRPAELLRRRWG